MIYANFFVRKMQKVCEKVNFATWTLQKQEKFCHIKKKQYLCTEFRKQ